MSLARSCEETLIHPLIRFLERSYYLRGGGRGGVEGGAKVQLQGAGIDDEVKDEGSRGRVCEREVSRRLSSL